MRLHSVKDYFASDEMLVFKYRKTRDAIKQHTHDFFELMCVMKGMGTQSINGQSVDFSSGSMFLIPGGVEHRISFSVETEYYDILIRNEVFDALRLGELGAVLSESADEAIVSWCGPDTYIKLCGILQTAYREYENKGVGSDAVLQSLLEVLLIWLLRNRGTFEKVENPRERRVALPQLLDYINSHYTEPLRLYDVAERYHYSPNPFSKMFRKRFGMTFTDYLHKKRVEAAKERLKLSTDTVSDICRAVGYTNSNEFYRVFRAQVGMTPVEYRRKKEADRLHGDLSFTEKATERSGSK